MVPNKSGINVLSGEEYAVDAGDHHEIKFI